MEEGHRDGGRACGWKTPGRFSGMQNLKSRNGITVHINFE